ncbi:MAG: MmgE/PrpD family protein [Rhizobiaceae bacterium]
MPGIKLTQAAGEFSSSIRYQDLPQIAIGTVRSGFCDAYAAMLAGRREPAVQTLQSFVQSHRNGGSVPCLLGTDRGTAETAALIDATAIHALDFDDYAFSNHPSAVLVPAIMSCAHSFDGDGRRMITAYCCGYEIWADLMRREPDHLHAKGWHPTAVLGPIGAAAAAAHMLVLDPVQSTHAIALSASHAGGLMGNFGSMAKPYHAGLAAEAGVRAALLARSGFTAREDVLESQTGLLAALSPMGNFDIGSEPEYGRGWLIEKLRLNFKKYPMVGASQRCIDALLSFIAANPVEPDDVVGIRAHVSDRHAKVMPFSEPQTPAEAKFSLHFACAAAVRFGKVGLNEVSAAALADPKLRDLMNRTSVVAGHDYDPDYPGAAPEDFVDLALRDGSELTTSRVRRATGHADNPLSIDEAWRKFAECADWSGIAETAARTLYDQLLALENSQNAEFAALDW